MCKLVAMVGHLFSSDVPEAVDSDSIQVTSKTITSATVEWTQAKDTHYSILYYHLRLATCNGEFSHDKCQLLRTFNSTDNATAYTLDSLTPFAVYTLEIAAENSVGIGPYSKPVMVQCKLQHNVHIHCTL